MEIEHKAAVYAITNTMTDERYIGSTVDALRRWRDHRTALRRNGHHSPHLQSAWNKYGAAAFEFIVLEYCDRADDEYLREREQFFMDQHRPEYNHRLIAESRLGVRHSPESIERMREAARRAWADPERRARRIQKTVILQPGRAKSEEHRDKLRAANAGKKKSAEVIQHLRELYKGRQVAKVPPEALARMAETKRRQNAERRAAQE